MLEAKICCSSVAASVRSFLSLSTRPFTISWISSTCSLAIGFASSTELIHSDILTRAFILHSCRAIPGWRSPAFQCLVPSGICYNTGVNNEHVWERLLRDLGAWKSSKNKKSPLRQSMALRHAKRENKGLQGTNWYTVQHPHHNDAKSPHIRGLTTRVPRSNKLRWKIPWRATTP